MSQRGLRTPFLRVARSGSTLGDGAFTAGGGIGAAIADQVSDDKLVRLFSEGATLVLQGLHRTWAPLTHFSQGLAADLGHPVQVNAYVTPPENQGFSDHYDVHDVFVLQTHGRKQWRLRRPVRPAPLRDELWTDRRAEVEAAATQPPELEAVLEPGDCLYLPRGWLHAATAQGEVSTHVTIGVHTWTRHHIARHLLDRALAEAGAREDVRASLPLGVDVGSASGLAPDVEDVRAALVEALGGVPAQAVADLLREAARSAQRAAPVGPLAQHRAAQEVADGSVVHLREHLAATLEEADGGHVLRSRAGTLALEADDLDAVAALLADGSLRVRSDHVELARRLLRAGVVAPRSGASPSPCARRARAIAGTRWPVPPRLRAAGSWWSTRVRGSRRRSPASVSGRACCVPSVPASAATGGGCSWCAAPDVAPPRRTAAGGCCAALVPTPRTAVSSRPGGGRCPRTCSSPPPWTRPPRLAAGGRHLTPAAGVHPRPARHLLRRPRPTRGRGARRALARDHLGVHPPRRRPVRRQPARRPGRHHVRAVDGTDPVRLVEDHLAGRVDAVRLRGWSHLHPWEQAAAVHLHRELGPLPVSAVAVETGLTEHVVASQRWRVHLRAPGGATRVLDVRAQPAPAARLTCRAASDAVAVRYVVQPGM